jgi:glycosyltransferase involved in cell wall biosynthesis
MPATYAEPKGFTIIEAMANGLPVVQPDHGAFTELVTQSGGGVLVPPKDPQAIASALFELLTDRARADALGRAGAEGVRRHYTLDRMAEVAERTYADAIR